MSAFFRASAQRVLALALGAAACSTPGGDAPGGGVTDGAAPLARDAANTDDPPASPDSGHDDAGHTEHDDDGAAYKELPVANGADAPVVASISVTCANSRSGLPPGAQGDPPGSSAIYPAAFVRVSAVTDAQGFGDLRGGELVLFDALTGGKGEMKEFRIESFGVFFDGAYVAGYFSGVAGATARSAFCEGAWWPAEVTVADSSGHVTKAKIRVPVLQ